MVARYRGRQMAFVLADVEHRLKRSLPAKFEELSGGRIGDLFAPQLKPMPGAAEMLSALRLSQGTP